jgi:hypothetical protein
VNVAVRAIGRLWADPRRMSRRQGHITYIGETLIY